MLFNASRAKKLSRFFGCGTGVEWGGGIFLGSGGVGLGGGHEKSRGSGIHPPHRYFLKFEH